MFSHIAVGANDLPRARKFHDAVPLSLGRQRMREAPGGGSDAACDASPNQALPLCHVHATRSRRPATVGHGGMLAFWAPSETLVDRGYAAGLAAGGACAGMSGKRPRYGKGYDGVCPRDPDGHEAHSVYCGDMRRAAAGKAV